jgi:hypothetical protein
MFKKVIENSPFPGIADNLNLEITVPKVSFLNDQMEVQFVIGFPGEAQVSLRNSTASFPCPPQLKAALAATFNAMVQPMIDKLNADYAAQQAELAQIRAEANAAIAETAEPNSHD